MGQKFLTPNLSEKMTLAKRFWNVDTSMDWRQELLSHWNVNYVYEGLYERQLSGTEIAVPGAIVYQNGGVTIYEVDQ